jgi:hypothetical protein
MLNEIQVGRYNGVLHKLLDMKEGAPAPTLATDIFPTIQLEGNRPEWDFLAGIRRCMRYSIDAAVAGQYSHIGLYNPAGSDALVILDRVVFDGAANTTFTGRLATGITWDTLVSGTMIDSRWASGATTAKVGIYTNATPLDGSGHYFRVLANYSLVLDNLGIILHPGYSWYTRGGSVNLGANCTFFWRERHLSPSETR